MKPKIVELSPKKLVGMYRAMSLANNQTQQLWQGFMPRRLEIKNRVSTAFYSMQKYDANLLTEGFALHTQFEKWAAVEVDDFDEVPAGMEAYELTGGKYAVFVHKGPASAFKKTFDYIFEQWLPSSVYTLDHREHFELLPEGYSPVDPNAEEEVWIPIK